MAGKPKRPVRESRRTEVLKAPQGGWPRHPIGDEDDLDGIVEWLMPQKDNRQHSIVVATRGDARTWVLTIAKTLLADLESNAASPTLRIAEEQLDKFRETLLEAYRMSIGFSGPEGLMRIVALECGFFRQMSHEMVDWDEILATPLLAAAAVVDRYKAELAESISTRRGHQKLHDRLFGDPRLQFARTSADLLRECRGGEEAPVPSDAVVLDLMDRIWTFAIGERPPAGFLDAEARAGASAVRKRTPRGRPSRLLRGLIRGKIVH